MLLREQLLAVPIIRSNWMSDNTQSYAAPPAPVLLRNQVSLRNIHLVFLLKPLSANHYLMKLAELILLGLCYCLTSLYK